MESWSDDHAQGTQLWAIEAGDAVGQWNYFLRQDAAAPRFAVSTGSGDVDVSVVGADTATKWCGTFNGSLTEITIRDRANCGINAKTGSWSTALLQELAGILGWSENVEQVEERFEPGLTDKCVLNLTKASPDINTEVCVHEAEGVVLAYRDLDILINDSDDFWRDSVYMHVQIKSSSVEAVVGDTLQVVADTFYSGGLGTGSMPSQQQVVGHIPIAKPTNGQVVYNSSNTSTLLSLGSGHFLATSVGNTYVRAKPSAAASTRTRWWLPFAERGDSIPVFVISAPPPPPPPDIVTTDQVPIQQAGLHTFTAHIGGSGSTIYWAVDDSRTINTNPDATYVTAGQTLTLNVAPGSYRLRFYVGLSSPTQIQDIPVCTGDSEPNFAAPDRRMSGGGSTDAVENCPPGGGSEQ